MNIIRGPLKPIPTAWATAADTGGTGTGNVASAAMTQVLGNLPEYYDFYIEVQATLLRTGGSGSVRATAVLAGYGDSLLTTASTAASLKYTTFQSAQDTSRTKKWIIKPNVVQSIGTDLADRMQINVHAVGSAADTEFTVTDIKSRLLYFPL